MLYTLGQFTRPAPETGIILPEEKLLERYIKTRKKEYLDLVKQNEKRLLSQDKQNNAKVDRFSLR